MLKRIAGIFLFSVLTFLTGQAQLTLSPYSRYGLGETFGFSSTRNYSMGGLGIGSANYNSVNVSNPASYAALRYTTLDLSSYFAYVKQNDANGKSENLTGGFHNFSLAFRTNKNIGLSVGIGPYSSVGYDVRLQDSILVDTAYEKYSLLYRGDGGLNQAYFGISVRFIKRLFVGVNFSYLFGTSNYSYTSVFSNANYKPFNYRDEVTIKGFLPRIGVQYQDTIKFKVLVDEVKEGARVKSQFQKELGILGKSKNKLSIKKAELDVKDKEVRAFKAEIEKERNVLQGKIDELRKVPGVDEKAIIKLERQDRVLARKRKRKEQAQQKSVRKWKDQDRRLAKQIQFYTRRIEEIDDKVAKIEAGTLERKVKKDRKILYRIGGIIDPPMNVSGERVIEYSNPSVIDTLGGTVKSKVGLPLRYGFGFTLTQPAKWTAGVDVSVDNWKTLKYFGEPNTLTNAIKFNVGGEYIPDYYSSKFHKRIAYRAGAYYERTLFNKNGTQISEMGVTAGVGVPIGRPERGLEALMFSRINLGLSYGIRGTTTNNLVKEGILMFRLGVNLNDRWFIRRRFD